MLERAAGDPIPARRTPTGDETISAIVPVLNEARRLGPCLQGLAEQGPWLREILVVDGGSHDATRELVASYAHRDPRIRLVDAAPVPDTWNGKAWGLQCGLKASNRASDWILTVDADVRPSPDLTASLLARASVTKLDAFSIAPLMEFADDLDAIVQPSMLTTIVYRQGPPGSVATRPEDAQANGQCFIARRHALERSDAFGVAKASRAEDITVARHLVHSGYAVGFFEGQSLASVQMYADAYETWDNWPRSLPLADSSTPVEGTVRGMAEIALVQALPLPLLALQLLLPASRRSRSLVAVNVMLSLVRLGTLIGTSRSYASLPLTYWLSPLADVPVVIRIFSSWQTPDQMWRGRQLVSDRA
jgi:dolichol-phosphate mannosyltransferase